MAKWKATAMDANGNLMVVEVDPVTLVATFPSPPIGAILFETEYDAESVGTQSLVGKTINSTPNTDAAQLAAWRQERG